MVASDSSNSGNNNANKNDSLASLFKSMGGLGDDCDRPACDDTKSALTAALQRVHHRSSKKDTFPEGVPDTDTARSTVKVEDSYRACPPTRDELGVSTWSLLHSMVRVYPLQVALTPTKTCSPDNTTYNKSGVSGSMVPQ